MAGQQRGQPVRAVDAHRPFPGEVVQPHVVERHRLGRDAEQRGEVALEADRHVAQPDRAVPGVEQRPGDHADRVGEVDQPRARRGPPPRQLGDLEHEGNGAQRLGEPARPGGLLPHAAEVERPGLVPVARRLPADPELDEHRGRAVDAVFLVGGPPDGRLVPVRAHDPGRHRPDHGQPGLVRVDQDQLGDLRREPPKPVRELRRVGRTAADNSEFHVRPPCGPGWCAWVPGRRPHQPADAS